MTGPWALSVAPLDPCQAGGLPFPKVDTTGAAMSTGDRSTHSSTRARWGAAAAAILVIGLVAGATRAWDAAPHIMAPTLLVQADVSTDGALRDEVAAEFVRRLPNGRLLRIPGAAHAVHASHPNEVGHAVRELVDSAGFTGASAPSASA